jgi:hypothetical protein
MQCLETLHSHRSLPVQSALDDRVRGGMQLSLVHGLRIALEHPGEQRAEVADLLEVSARLGIGGQYERDVILDQQELDRGGDRAVMSSRRPFRNSAGLSP